MFSCGSDEGKSTSDQDAQDEEAIVDYLTDNDLLEVTDRDNSGIYYQITTETNGSNTSSGDVLSIYYKANALGEQAFDAVINDGTNEPVKLQHNTNSVYPLGLDQCLNLMKAGEKGIFYIPSALAYGDLDDLSSIIPSNSVIVIEIELAAIESEADVFATEITAIELLIQENFLDDETLTPVDPIELLPSGVYYKRTVEGTADETLNKGQRADINYLIYSLSTFPNGTPLDGTANNEIFSFGFQTGSVISGLDAGVAEMERKETALIIMPSSKAYGASAFVIPRNRKSYLVSEDIIPDYASKVSPYQVLVFEVKLLEEQTLSN